MFLRREAMELRFLISAFEKSPLFPMTILSLLILHTHTGFMIHSRRSTGMTLGMIASCFPFSQILWTITLIMHLQKARERKEMGTVRTFVSLTVHSSRVNWCGEGFKGKTKLNFRNTSILLLMMLFLCSSFKHQGNIP